jgi:hypothetical protein
VIDPHNMTKLMSTGQTGGRAKVHASAHHFADVLARQIEERLGRLQDARFGPDVAGLRERQ